ncbi:MAG TPA: efflux RND transporter permease subunit [Gemmataceae bacterium]|jgi:multidrug efflux pump subunit AcrB
MNGLIRASLGNPYAVTVSVLSIAVIGAIILLAGMIPMDILPVFKSPAVQVLTFYNGMPAGSIEKDITNRMERWTGQTAGMKRQESRSLIGCSIIRNYYKDDVDPNGALTQVNSLASAAIPNLPPGTLPPVILPFDPTGTTPVCLIALDSDKETESILYDVGRYEVRNMVMSNPGAVSPVVYGGKLRAVIAYLDKTKMQARGLSPVQVMDALDLFNIFLPTGDAKFGRLDYAVDSNSMYDLPTRMRNIPIKMENGKPIFLGDVADPQDAALIQTNIVRVNGRKQVYIPVYRQVGASTLEVVNNLRRNLPSMQERLSRDDIELKMVMDQSVYVEHSIKSLATEGALGAILCSLVILLFLGEWRMTLIAVLTIPVSVLAAAIALYYTGNTINVMTLAGLSLAIGPLVDSAIICLENTHRHLGMGTEPKESAFLGASEVAMPELVASCCTLLVLAPLALMPGLGTFLFRPMALAVAFAMIVAYILSRSFVPMMCAIWLRPHAAHHEGAPVQRGPVASAFARWEAVINVGINVYVRLLKRAMQFRLLVVGIAATLFLLVVVGLGFELRREFFPEVDAGAFEIYVRAPTGTRIDLTEKEIIKVEKMVHQKLGGDLETLISEIGVVADWSAAYTPNAGPMDAVVKVQLKHDRAASAQEHVRQLRQAFASDPQFEELEFAFDAGGMIRSAMNEGKSTPINIRITGKDLNVAHQVAEKIQREVRQIDSVVDCRIMQRLDYPQYVINIDRTKAADLGLTQVDVMKNVVASVNNSIQFNKKNFWIDPVTHNQYYVGVQYPEQDIKSLDTLRDILITSPKQPTPIPLRNIAEIVHTVVPAEVNHTNLQPTIDLTMSVEGRDLGHVSDDVAAIVGRFGQPVKEERWWVPKGLPESWRYREVRGTWQPFEPGKPGQLLGGSQMTLSGEYSKMQETFTSLAGGLGLASLLIYFLMVALFKSWLTPLVVMSAVPVGLVGVILMLFLTGTALNVQSLLGMIFMVGIVVSNTVLLTDFTQHIRTHEGLSPTAAVTKAASIRVRPVVMTALAAFFALLPMALGLERGSEANTPLGRAVIGGLLAGLFTTLFVVPCLYSLVIRDRRGSVGPRPHGGDEQAITLPAH